MQSPLIWDVCVTPDLGCVTSVAVWNPYFGCEDQWPILFSLQSIQIQSWKLVSGCRKTWGNQKWGQLSCQWPQALDFRESVDAAAFLSLLHYENLWNKIHSILTWLSCLSKPVFISEWPIIWLEEWSSTWMLMGSFGWNCDTSILFVWIYYEIRLSSVTDIQMLGPIAYINMIFHCHKRQSIWVYMKLIGHSHHILRSWESCELSSETSQTPIYPKIFNFMYDNE